jgi:APA family basic amino acid/polyamine antiporter
MTVERSAAPRACLSLLDGVAMMVGIVIGIGVFKTPSLIASNVESGSAFMGVWLLGGFVTLIGALSYAELVSSEPNTGGEYHFLARAFGPHVAILFGWARGTVIQTGAIAAVAFVLGDYAAQIAPLGPNGPSLYAGAAIVLLTALNIVGTPLGKSVQVGLTALTLLCMLVVAATPLLTGAAPPAAAPTVGADGFGLAMILVLLTYGGWNESAYLASEMRDIRRDGVRMLVYGTLLLSALYALVNGAMLYGLGLDGLRSTQTPGADLMRQAAGEAGAVILSAIVVAAALSTLNGTIFTGARIYYAMGQDLPVLRRLGVWDKHGDNPKNAILLQGAISLALVVAGSITPNGFQAMVEYTAPVFWLFLFLVGLSLFVLRWREPDRDLPFRVPLYPLTPALFCCTCLYMLYASVTYTGYGALIGLTVLAAGLPLVLTRGRALR